jgi:5'(3')-deoxyribonucleotidase
MDMIYFDMDGVLCDFDGEYERLTGKRWDHAYFGMTRSEAVRSLSLEEKAEKWSKLNPHPNFFLELPWFPGAKGMLERVRDRVGVEQIGILSAASSHIPQSVEQKHQWLDRETPWILPVNRLVVKRKRDKTLYVRPGNILVDDFDVNTDRWTKAGGEAVLFVNAAQAEEEIYKLYEAR